MHRKGILLFCVYCGLFALVFGLYHLPVAAVGYAAALCLFVQIIVTAVDYGRFCGRHKRLLQLQNEITVTLEHAPAPENLTEQDYQELLQLLFQRGRELSEEKEAGYREMVEYYTLWVHQIKTPIAAMRLLLQGMEAPERQALTEELQRVEQYVEMVLCYLRMEGNSSDYVIKEYDLDEILKQAVRRHASAFIGKKISLNYEPTKVRVVTDEKWLFFVLDQILSNALKYTHKGSITISMEKPKTLCIRDTGIGIAPEDLPRIFERGYTGPNGREDKRASGIGLYLCRRICDDLNHRIFVTSVPGEGTEVRLDLKNVELEIE
ncbi:MAG: sensor histidine kinase [Lachnospiraceae bacterium]|nr:sensor histidine kinase [Lachnospiraceae bacterium]